MDGAIPDTFDGRFAILATLAALALVRIEDDGDAGNFLSVGLTERFIEVMESEHRQLGIGDPTLGKIVRKLVGMLARRTELWRCATVDGWSETTRQSLYKAEVGEDSVDHSAAALKAFSERLSATSIERLEQGEIA